MDENLEKTVSLRDIWSVIRKCWYFMLAALVLISGAAYYAMWYTYTPQYEAEATMYVLRQKDDGKEYTSTDFYLAMDVVQDCTYVFKSRAVLEQVCEDLNITFDNETYKKISASISTANPQDTRFLTVKLKLDSPETATLIVNKICDVGADKIEETMGYRQVNVYEYAEEPADPCNGISFAKCLAFGVAGAGGVFVGAFFAFLFDDRFASPEDIETKLGISVLGVIPNENEKKNGYYRKYGKKYGKYMYKKADD